MLLYCNELARLVNILQWAPPLGSMNVYIFMFITYRVFHVKEAAHPERGDALYVKNHYSPWCSTFRPLSSASITKNLHLPCDEYLCGDSFSTPASTRSSKKSV